MDEFTKVGAVGDFREGRCRVVDVDGVKVAVFRVGERLHAIKDACPHMGASLGDGKLVDGNRRVTCHMHGWTFDLESGACSQSRQTSAKIYEVKVDAAAVFLRPPPPPPSRNDKQEWVVFDPDRHLKKK